LERRRPNDFLTTSGRRVDALLGSSVRAAVTDPLNDVQRRFLDGAGLPIAVTDPA
jgi:hypothetical protein